MNPLYIFIGIAILASITQYLLSLIFRLQNNKYWFYAVSTVLLEAIVYLVLFIGFKLFPRGDLGLAALLLIVGAVISISFYFFLIKKFVAINNNQVFALLFASGISVVVGMYLYDFVITGGIN